mmetsp:Transcript_3657/g.9312  ORF Transcript_3657/g.9312 Transcript_3657/m.9312 type:complete len:425 (+) Transcript_3657:737-2011(+)
MYWAEAQRGNPARVESQRRGENSRAASIRGVRRAPGPGGPYGRSPRASCTFGKGRARGDRRKGGFHAGHRGLWPLQLVPLDVRLLARNPRRRAPREKLREVGAWHCGVGGCWLGGFHGRARRGQSGARRDLRMVRTVRGRSHGGRCFRLMHVRRCGCKSHPSRGDRRVAAVGLFQRGETESACAACWRVRSPRAPIPQAPWAEERFGCAFRARELEHGDQHDDRYPDVHVQVPARDCAGVDSSGFRHERKVQHHAAARKHPGLDGVKQGSPDAFHRLRSDGLLEDPIQLRHSSRGLRAISWTRAASWKHGARQPFGAVRAFLRGEKRRLLLLHSRRKVHAQNGVAEGVRTAQGDARGLLRPHCAELWHVARSLLRLALLEPSRAPRIQVLALDAKALLCRHGEHVQHAVRDPPAVRLEGFMDRA